MEYNFSVFESDYGYSAEQSRVLNHDRSHDVARRIVNYAGEVSGSRIDIFLPLDSEIKVKSGDEVRACETILAVLPSV